MLLVIRRGVPRALCAIAIIMYFFTCVCTNCIISCYSLVDRDIRYRFFIPSIRAVEKVKVFRTIGVTLHLRSSWRTIFWGVGSSARVLRCSFFRYLCDSPTESLTCILFCIARYGLFGHAFVHELLECSWRSPVRLP